jgi:DNA-binding response OmpR family regulator
MYKRILVIAGQRHIARLVQVNLERQGIYVDIACSLDQARQIITAGCPDLILLDITPSKERSDFIQELRHNPETRDLPILQFTPPSQKADSFSDWPGPGGWSPPGMPGIRWYRHDEDDNEDDSKPQ